MNINPDHQPESELNAELAMEACMTGLADILLDPAMSKGELSEDDQNTLGIIGMTLKFIAEKARAFEELGNHSEQNEHFRN